MSAGETAGVLESLHAQMMAKAEDLWRRSRRADKEGDDDAQEQREACAMVAEECAALVAAAMAPPATPTPGGEL